MRVFTYNPFWKNWFSISFSGAIEGSSFDLQQSFSNFRFLLQLQSGYQIKRVELSLQSDTINRAAAFTNSSSIHGVRLKR